MITYHSCCQNHNISFRNQIECNLHKKDIDFSTNKYLRIKLTKKINLLFEKTYAVDMFP